MFRCILCAICRNNFTAGNSADETIFATRCGHVFHQHCIDDWIGRSRTCPYCRGNIDIGSKVKLNFCFGAETLEQSSSNDRDSQGVGSIVIDSSDPNSGDGIEVVAQRIEIIDLNKKEKRLEVIDLVNSSRSPRGKSWSENDQRNAHLEELNTALQKENLYLRKELKRTQQERDDFKYQVSYQEIIEI